jgi:hypothetical protein
MAKKAEEKNLPAKAQASGALADIRSSIIEDVGKGFEGVKPADVAIPFLVILQDLSPAVRKGPGRIEGAEAGDIIQTVSQQIFKANTGVVVVPCGFQKAYVEWTPRESGGGFVRQHLDENILKDCTKNERNQDMLKNGNQIVTTAYHYVVISNDGKYERAIVAMASTQLKKSRRWNSQMMSLQIDIDGKKVNPACFSHSYTLSTILETKDQNQWYNWAIGPANMLEDGNLYLFAKQFYQQVREGAVKVSAPPADEKQAPATEEHF